jgi:hypothetical protein
VFFSDLIPWTSYDDWLLATMARNGRPTTEIAFTLGRSVAAVYSRASLLRVSLLPPDRPSFSYPPTVGLF